MCQLGGCWCAELQILTYMFHVLPRLPDLQPRLKTDLPDDMKPDFTEKNLSQLYCDMAVGKYSLTRWVRVY